MKKLLFFISLFFISYTTYSQVFVNTTNTTSPNSCDGSAWINPSNLSSWTFMQSGSAISSNDTVNNLCVGYYTLISTNNIGVTDSSFFMIDDNCNLTASVTNFVQPTIGNCDGQITIGVSGGTPPYAFQTNPSNQSGLNVISNLCAGSIIYTVVDANGCIIDEFFTLTDPCSNFTAIETLTNVSASGTCDGTATITYSNNNGPVAISWADPNLSGFSLTNLCEGYYGYYITDSLGCEDSTYFQIGNPCSNFNPYISGTFNTPSNTCQGNLSIVTNQNATYVWNNGATTSSIINLCVGVYTCVVSNMNGCSVTLTGQIYDSTFNSFGGYVVSTTLSNSAPNCNGTVQLGVYGTSAPITYVELNSGNPSFTGYFSGLCAGVYDFMLIEQGTNDTSYVTAIVSDSSTYYGTNNYFGQPWLDTLLAPVLVNCNLTYNDIFSVTISNIDFINDSLYVTWEVTTNTGAIGYINQAYYFDSISNPSGVYSFQLSVYCPTKALGDYFVAYDQVMIDLEALGINENTSNTLNSNAYPNPFTNQVSVSIPSAGTYNVSINDMTGRIVYSNEISGENQLLIDGLNELNSGKYILTISNESNTFRSSIVK